MGCEDIITDLTILSAKTQSICQATWPAVEERWNEILTKTFERWFHIHLELKTVFYNSPEDMTIEEVVKRPVIVEHIGKVKKVMGIVVKNIMTPEKLSKTVEGLGKRHVKYGADAKYAAAFKESFMSSVADVMNVSAEIASAWENTLVFVLHHFAIGLQHGISSAKNN